MFRFVSVGFLSFALFFFMICLFCVLHNVIWVFGEFLDFLCRSNDLIAF